MKRYLCCGVALLVLAGHACASAQPLTPSRVAREIHVHGAQTTVQSLNRTGRMDAVLNKIASGNIAWVRLASDLAKGSDAGNSTGLSVALAHALPRNPKTVLAVLDDGPVTGSAVVCSVSFIEPTQREINGYLDRTIPAVERVPESDRLPHRTACLKALQRIAEQRAAHPS
ncbi:hypothetical protein [Paraburkholderia diazotrophica]|uniref:hypothetical protein n=1 Tax=Paraburkholderia diazotrophica TaxID=667676 RepID=UPI00316B3D54